LTSERLLLERQHVAGEEGDREEESVNAVYFLLNQIVKIGYQKGFLASSPKIRIYLNLPKDANPAAGSCRGDAAGAASTATQATWQCPLCRHENTFAPNSLKCRECGSGIPSSTLTQLLAYQEEKAEAASAFEDQVVLQIRLGFKSGGSTHFYEKLIYALERAASAAAPSHLMLPGQSFEARANTPSSFHSEASAASAGGGGLAHIMTKLEVAQKQSAAQLDSAFGDLDSLIAKASDMVHCQDIKTNSQ
jgi:hypothetical protein